MDCSKGKDVEFKYIFAKLRIAEFFILNDNDLIKISFGKWEKILNKQTKDFIMPAHNIGDEYLLKCQNKESSFQKEKTLIGIL